MPAISTPTTVSDTPRVASEQQKLDDLRAQLREAREQAEALRKVHSDSDSLHAAAAAVASGMPVDDAIEEASRAKEIQALDQRPRVLGEAVELQRARVLAVTREAIGHLQEAAKPEFIERLVAVAQGVQSALVALDELEQFLRGMQERGAGYHPATYKAATGAKDFQNLLRLPEPEKARDTYEKYYTHVRRHLPDVANEIDSAI